MAEPPKFTPFHTKILLVEDEEYLRDVYREVLVESGYQVDEAADGQQALDALKKGGYGLVFLDIMLPKMDGIQVLMQLQKTPPATPNGPIVILSNLEQEAVIAQGIKLGARSYLIKSNMAPADIVVEAQKVLINE